MYKILFLSLANDNPLDQHNFNIFEESFETRQEAINFIKGEGGPIHQDIVDYIDGDPEVEENTEFECDEYEDGNDYAVEHSVSYKPYHDLIYINKYKIVEIK